MEPGEKNLKMRPNNKTINQKEIASEFLMETLLFLTLKERYIKFFTKSSPKNRPFS